MNEITVPIYLMTGFLESGKTSFLSFTIRQVRRQEFWHLTAPIIKMEQEN